MLFPDRAFEAPDGILLNDLAGILSGAIDPSVSGQEAPIGTLFLRSNGQLFKKTSAGDTDWTEITTGAVFGTQFNAAESLGRSTTTSTAFQFKLNLNVVGLPAGDYIILWSAAIGNSDEEIGVTIRVELDNTTELINVRPQVGRDVLTEWSHNSGGHAIVTLSGTHDFDIDFAQVAGEGDPGVAFIEDAYLTLWRVT